VTLGLSDVTLCLWLHVLEVGYQFYTRVDVWVFTKVTVGMTDCFFFLGLMPRGKGLLGLWGWGGGGCCLHVQGHRIWYRCMLKWVWFGRRNLSAIHEGWREVYRQRAVQRGRGFRVHVHQNFPHLHINTHVHPIDLLSTHLKHTQTSGITFLCKFKTTFTMKSHKDRLSD